MKRALQHRANSTHSALAGPSPPSANVGVPSKPAPVSKVVNPSHVSPRKPSRAPPRPVSQLQPPLPRPRPSSPQTSMKHMPHSLASTAHVESRSVAQLPPPQERRSASQSSKPTTGDASKQGQRKSTTASSSSRSNSSSRPSSPEITRRGRLSAMQESPGVPVRVANVSKRRRIEEVDEGDEEDDDNGVDKRGEEKLRRQSSRDDAKRIKVVESAATTVAASKKNSAVVSQCEAITPSSKKIRSTTPPLPVTTVQSRDHAQNISVPKKNDEDETEGSSPTKAIRRVRSSSKIRRKSSSSSKRIKASVSANDVRSAALSSIVASTLREHSDDGSQDQPEPDGWFLKHQNRSLATELFRYKRQLDELIEEREIRRRHCDEAHEGLLVLVRAWEGVEDGVKIALSSAGEGNKVWEDKLKAMADESKKSKYSYRIETPSSGDGSNIETVSAVLGDLHSLARLPSAEYPTLVNSGPEDTEDAYYIRLNNAIQVLSDGLSKRAQRLTEAIQKVCRVAMASWEKSSKGRGIAAVAAFDESMLKEADFLNLKEKIKKLKRKVADLSAARDETNKLSHRIHRKLEKLAAGTPIREVLKEVEEGLGACGNDNVSDDGSDGASASSQATSKNPVSDNAIIKELEAVLECREQKINELLQLQDENEFKITKLVSERKTPSEKEIKKSDVYKKLSLKLSSAHKAQKVADVELVTITQRLATARGEILLLHKKLEDQREKYERRWRDLVQLSESRGVRESPERIRSGAGGLNGDKKNTNLDNYYDKKDEKIVELEHKLRQALGGARHTETYRTALEEARLLSEALEGEVEDLKRKLTLSTQSPTGGAGRQERPMDNLLRENSSLRQLARANSRLLKQGAQKEEVNVASLSEIMKLKQQEELQSQEIAALKKRAKEAEQISLAARMASNARARLEEEILKEKREFEDQITLLREECVKASSDKEEGERICEKLKGDISTMAKEKTEVEARCEELAKELSKSSREHIRLEEKVVKLKATLQLAAATAPDGGGGTSASSASAPENQHGSSRLSAAEAQFTPQQMAIQIRNLKHKLACPVCKDREKKCILKRCNHMFCRQCVDENIKNRSRKCPACGLSFGKDDVGDVW
eukprot:CAMPEP_0113306298 /NCGR_PEP_ID=MMETSP0010_2-20120614/5602_1 /TAXON_ID=216773 ORGANISM="Corethron hystrix, Strain 308" /NCGR_SAMPLE_ID=MMETSP0010_2 /ASSEMBLY_ACC=CAM_ASM_000155 /LENGTH=1110 /DNA_ID=CAMNT_0000160931 /DNA_START=742 /DNA_END=4071 /DNA_ORIENTATION=+ /assembly_acc=CAM_ASM_000155